MLWSRFSAGPWAALVRCLVMVLLCALVPSRAGAVTDEEKAGARAAAEEAVKAFQEARYPDALDLMTRAEALVHSPLQLLYIGRCHAQTGKLVKARETFLSVSREGAQPGASSVAQRAKTEADQELAALTPRLATLTVSVSGAGTGAVTVTMDGGRVPDVLVGVPHPVDPGEHELQATAEGLQSQPTKVTLAEGGNERVTLELAPSPPGSGPAATPPADGASSVAVASEGPSAQGGGLSTMRLASYITAGVGVLAVIPGVIFAVNSSSKSSDADALFSKYSCGTANNTTCLAPQQAEIHALDSKASSASTLSVVSFVGAGLLIGTGVTLFVLSADDGGASASAKAELHPWVGLGSAGLSGTF